MTIAIIFGYNNCEYSRCFTTRNSTNFIATTIKQKGTFMTQFNVFSHNGIPCYNGNQIFTKLIHFVFNTVANSILACNKHKIGHYINYKTI